MMAEMPAARAKPSASSIIAICFAITLLEGYDIQAIGVAAPKLAPSLHLAPGLLGLVFTGGMIGLVLGALTGGWLVDKISRRPLLIAAVALFGVSSILTAFATTAVTLIAARFLTGLGLGAAMPALINVAIEVSTPQRRTRTVTTMFCGMPAGGALAGLFAVYAFQHLGWQSIFVVGGLAPLALIPFLLTLPETRSAAPKHAVEVRAAAALFGDRRAAVTLLLWLTFGLTLMILYMLLNWLPSLVASKDLAQVNGAQAGAQAALAFNLASVGGSLAVGMLVDRFGLRLPVAAAYLGLVVGLMGLSAANGLIPILAWSGLAGFCLLGAQFCLYGAAPMYYPTAARGLGTGAAIAIGRLGSIAGPMAAGQLVAVGIGASGVAMAMTPVVIVAGLAATAMATLGRLEPS